MKLNATHTMTVTGFTQWFESTVRPRILAEPMAIPTSAYGGKDAWTPVTGHLNHWRNDFLQ